MALMPYRPHVGFIWHGSCEGQVTTYPTCTSIPVDSRSHRHGKSDVRACVFAGTPLKQQNRGTLRAPRSNTRVLYAITHAHMSSHGLQTRLRTCVRDRAHVHAIVRSQMVSLACIRYRSLAYAIAMLADAIARSQARLRSSCYMSSHTLWAKATGSAGRMPSTNRA